MKANSSYSKAYVLAEDIRALRGLQSIKIQGDTTLVTSKR